MRTAVASVDVPVARASRAPAPPNYPRGSEAVLAHGKLTAETTDDRVLRLGIWVSVIVLLMLLLAACYVVWAKIEFAWPFA